MRQTDTPFQPQAVTKPKGPDMTLKEAALVLAATSLLSLVIGLIPHFH